LRKSTVETFATLTEKAREKLVTAEIRRKAPKEHRRTQGWLRQVAMPGEASGDARLPSAGGDFEACLFAQTSFGFARPIRSIEKELVETVALLTREPRSWLVSCQNHIRKRLSSHIACFLSLFFVVSNMVFLEAKLHLKLKASSRFLGSLSLRRRMAKRLRITVHSFQLHLVVLAAARKSTSPSARLLQVR